MSPGLRVPGQPPGSRARPRPAGAEQVPGAAALGAERGGDPGKELCSGAPREGKRGETQGCSLQKGWAHW